MILAMRQVGPPLKKQNMLTFGSLLGILLLWYGIEIIDFLIFDGWLDVWGVRPRELGGLIGIPLMPFLHGGFAHLMSNSIPFLILGYIVLKAEKIQFIYASVTITLIGGLGTWLIGRGGASVGAHIGASGLIYGYFGYIMMRGMSERRIGWIIIALIIGISYGSLIFGALPTVGAGISWEGHLCGMLAGAWFGRGRALESRARRAARKQSARLPS